MKETLKQLGIEPTNPGTFDGTWSSRTGSTDITSVSPVDGQNIAGVISSTPEEYESVIKASSECFESWRMVPAPLRGEVVREIGNEFRRLKKPLGALIAYEMGKIRAEGEGEVQEVIDIADFAVGLSRQLYGNSTHSERPQHRMYEQWQPLGIVGVITAFNFPVAVWGWNALIAAVCGDTTVWKPSELTPLCAVAVTNICKNITDKHNVPALFTLLNGAGSEMGQRIAADKRIPLVSATGSCRMGRSVGETVAKRLGRSLLELGGNNALIIMDDANLEIAIPATVFGAVGTAGQRCTSTRRLLVHSSIIDKVQERLIAAYRQVTIGNPLEEGTLMGPLINQSAIEQYTAAIALATEQGGTLVAGGKIVSGKASDLYVEPTLIRANAEMPIVKEETFAPILYLIPIDSLDEAIRVNNAVPQGLSSAIFSERLRDAETFLSPRGSDCGIANVNIGTSGAEIGGAFGGEKDTGGGREAGSDSWKAYMRRQTTTINWSSELPLAQGIQFT